MSSSSSKPINPFAPPSGGGGGGGRLHYRAIHSDSPRDLQFIHHIQSDSLAQSGSSYGLLRPEGLQDSKGFRDYLVDHSKCLLGVIFYLPSLPPTSSSPHPYPSLAPESSTPILGFGEHEGGGEDAKEAEKNIPVGILALKQNPLHQTHHRWTDVSIDVSSRFRGQGYGSEALRYGLWYAFQMAGLHKVQIQAFGFNDGALKLYRRLGFKEEGRLRDHMWFDGRWHDNVILGMLEGEWRDMQKEEKEKKGKEEGQQGDKEGSG